MPKNPFKITKQNNTPQQASAVANSDEARAIQEVQAALVIAKRFPRDQFQAMERITQACTRPSLAESALYSYSKGGASITGPSVRLAEAIAQAWGNILFGIRELSSDNGNSTVEAFAWDTETNTKQTKVFIVPHERHTRNGKKILTDPRDIYEIVANNGARRLRACILGIIPGDVIEVAVQQCEETTKASVDMSPESLKKISDSFLERFGVKKSQIEKRIQCRFESIRPAQVINLRKIFQSLHDEMSSPEDWFERESQLDNAFGEPEQEEETPLCPEGKDSNQCNTCKSRPGCPAHPEPEEQGQSGKAGLKMEGF